MSEDKSIKKEKPKPSTEKKKEADHPKKGITKKSPVMMAKELAANKKICLF